MRFCLSFLDALSANLLNRTVRSNQASNDSAAHLHLRAATLAIVASVLFCALPARADSVSVTYTVVNLGAGTWEYEYTLSGSLSSGDDVAIYFPLATSSNITDLGTGGADFTTYDFPPDPGLPAEGEYDITANVDDPSLAPVFDVSFTYSGAGSPGPQMFNFYDANFDQIGAGETVAAVAVGPSPVPEPLSLSLLASGLVLLPALRQRRRR